MFKGRDIKSLDNQVNKEASLVPKLPFSLYLSSPKGSGKSVMLLNCLLSCDLLAGKFEEIYIINPTAHLDIKYNKIKNVPGILKINKPLIKLLKANNNNVKLMDSANETTYESNSVITDENFIKKVDIKLIKDLIEEQDYIIKTYGKENANNVLIIYDDCISSKTFFNSPEVQNCMFLSRHYKISLIITSQNYKSLNLPLRNNMSMIALWITYNNEQLKSIYQENSSSSNFKTFLNIYKTVCESKAFHFLIVNYQSPPKYRLQSGFESFIDESNFIV
jgi:flagellar biosynthesis regulator FlaF